MSYKIKILNMYGQNKLTFLVDKDGDERCHQTQYDLDTDDCTHSYNNR